MCARTTTYTPASRIAELFDADPAPGADDADGPRWNVGPTNRLLGLREGAGEGRPGRLILDRYRWGLVPPWASDPAVGHRLFNARAESLATRAAFRRAFAARRLAVVVDGFFEWRRDPGRRRQPFYFRRADGFPLVLAGLWETWREPGTGSWLRSCTIVTTEAGADLEGVHDRMPVVLERERLGDWLHRGHAGSSDRGALLRPAAAGTLLRHPVDPRVGDVRHDDPGLLERVEPAQGRLLA